VFPRHDRLRGQWGIRRINPSRFLPGWPKLIFETCSINLIRAARRTEKLGKHLVGRGRICHGMGETQQTRDLLLAASTSPPGHGLLLMGTPCSQRSVAQYPQSAEHMFIHRPPLPLAKSRQVCETDMDNGGASACVWLGEWLLSWCPIGSVPFHTLQTGSLISRWPRGNRAKAADAHAGWI